MSLSQILHKANATKTLKAETLQEVDNEDCSRQQLTRREIKLLKNSWFKELRPKFVDDIVGKQFINVQEAMESEMFWDLATEILNEDEMMTLHDKTSYKYHQSSCFARAVHISMTSIDDLESLDAYFEQIGMLHLRMFDAKDSMFETLSILTVELLKLSFADAFDLELQYTWSKFINMIIAKMTKSKDVKLPNAKSIYANENALVPTVVMIYSRSGVLRPLNKDLATHERIRETQTHGQKSPKSSSASSIRRKASISSFSKKSDSGSLLSSSSSIMQSQNSSTLTLVPSSTSQKTSPKPSQADSNGFGKSLKRFKKIVYR